MNIHTIDLEFRGIPGVIASFLVEHEGNAFLIETGPMTCLSTLESKIRDLGFECSSLDGVFVTHIHLDHAGAAGVFAAKGVPVYVHPKGHKHLVDPTRLQESARMVYGDDFDSLWGEMTPAPSAFVKSLSDCEVVGASGLEVKAIETPGHAFHHHAFLVGGKVIFAGDSAGARLSGSNYTSVTSAPPQFHLESKLESVDKLLKINPEKLFLTHFGGVEDPANHLSSYRETVDLNATFVSQRLLEGMDADSLRIAYQAFQMEQAFRAELPGEMWERCQAINGTDMCADGIRLYWERKANEDS